AGFAAAPPVLGCGGGGGDALPERLHDLVGPDGSVDLAALLPADLATLIGDRR
ncbi:MAG: hypothetical protein IRY85_06555, partial [Micromonosporaceae bacterium]|nr:hypothetical protein [Micromonosporaceae bacterium]